MSACNCAPSVVPPAIDPSQESVQSALDNFILNFYGAITKAVVNGQIVWTLPCDLAAALPGYPRDPSLGTACYFKSLFATFGVQITSAVAQSLAAQTAAAAAQTAAGTATTAAATAQTSANSALALIAALGTMASQNASTVAITGGAITGTAITGLPPPYFPSDACTKAYADGIAGGILPRTPVRLASTANVANLASVTVIDGITLANGDRVLLKNQSTPSQNGIYSYTLSTTTLARAVDADTSIELQLNQYYFVTAGSTNIASGWFISTSPVTLGTDPIQFAQFSASTSYTAGAGLTLTGSTLSVNAAQPGITSLGTLSELKANYGVFVGPIGSYDSTAGALYAGFTAGGSFLRSVADNSGTQAPLSFQIGNGSQVGLLTTTGLNACDLGITTPGKVRATAVGTTTILNVRLFGAVGDGTTDDTAAINAAIAALTSLGGRATLYFPPGKYRLASAPSTFSSVSHVIVRGEGAEIYNDSGSSGGSTFTFDSTCSFIRVSDLRFTGTSSIRGNGIHIRMYASNSIIRDNYLSGCSDFAVHVSSSVAGYTSNVVVANNIIVSPLGDGIHVGSALNVSIVGNVLTSTGDDSIALVADNVAYPPSRISVVGNQITGSSFRGIAVLECYDVLVEANNIATTVGAAIEIGRYTSTTAYNTRISINGNRIYNSTTTVGPRGAISVAFIANGVVSGNQIASVVFGSGISFLDVADLSILNNVIYGSASRGIASDDGTTANVAAAWGLLTIAGNVIQYNVAYEAIYVVPASGKTISNLLILDNKVQSTAAGNWIYYDRITTGKVGNNTSRDGLTIAAGGSVTLVTTFNNN